MLRAAARVREAYLALARADLVAPVDGYVARRSVQLGQRVQAGAPLMSVVALNQVWVDANFKESQLRRLRIGQPVVLEADVYGSRVDYHGTIEGLGAGTGAAFALLPAQNATGNWIKVVQRVPVRIALDPKEVAEPSAARRPVDGREGRRDATPRAACSPMRSQRSLKTETRVFDQASQQADGEVKRIIAANLGRAVKANAACRPPAPTRKPSPARRAAVPARSAHRRRRRSWRAHADPFRLPSMATSSASAASPRRPPQRRVPPTRR